MESLPEPSPAPSEKACKHCGEAIDRKAAICPKCGVKQPGGEFVMSRRVAAAMLAIILGAFGVHKFFLGDIPLGILYLAITLLSCGYLGLVVAVVGVVEGIIYLTLTDEAFDAKYPAAR